LGIFTFFYTIGTIDLPITLEIKKAAIPKKANSTSLNPGTQKSISEGKTKVKDSVKPIKTGGIERILLIGDSQLEAMRKPFFKYATTNGHQLSATVLWYGSSSKQWANTDTLAYYITKYKPTMVVLVLGLNELFVNDFDQRKLNIQKIKKQLINKGINYYWIGPAAWKKDLGVIDIMQSELGNRFFPSHKLTLGRAKDNRHPSNDAAWVWMKAVAKETTKNGLLSLPKPIQGKVTPKKSPFILLKVPK
jgi:hypothetical protein